MDIAKKLDYARQAINVIAQHDDEDSAVRKAALDRLNEHIEAERAAIAARVAERIAAQAAINGQ